MLTFPQGGVKEVPMRHKPYRNKRIVSVIRNLFFTGGTSAYAYRYDSNFPRFRGPDGVLVREIPEPMLGLVATAVRVTYQTGHHTNMSS